MGGDIGSLSFIILLYPIRLLISWHHRMDLRLWNSFIFQLQGCCTSFWTRCVFSGKWKILFLCCFFFVKSCCIYAFLFEIHLKYAKKNLSWRRITQGFSMPHTPVKFFSSKRGEYGKARHLWSSVLLMSHQGTVLK